MKIGIIGAGHIGGTLARRLVPLGHAVVIANSRGPETLADLARESGATAVTAAEAVKDRDLVVVTIPMKDVPKLGRLFNGVPAATIVVDTCNYYPRFRDGKLPGIEEAPSETDWVSQHIGRPTIKAFNNIYAKSLMEKGKPAGDPARIALSVAGDDAGQKATVMGLVEALGFDAVDGGSRAESWRQQPGTPGYCKDLPRQQAIEALQAASRSRQPEFIGRPEDPQPRA